MDANMKTARIAGILLITATLAGTLGGVVLKPVLDAPDYLIYVSVKGTQVVIGALLAFIMAIAVAGIPVVVYPVLRKQNEVLALGYVVLRSGLEAVIHIAVVISWLLLLPLSQVYIQAGAPDTSNLHALATLVVEADVISSIGTIVCSLGAVLFYGVLYQSRLIPRWVSGWGLIAVVPYSAVSLLSLLSPINPLSTIGIALQAPFALQEVVLAVWLIVNGFNASSITSESTRVAMNNDKRSMRFGPE